MNTAKMCSIAVTIVGLSLAAAYLTPAYTQTRTEQWCVNVGGTNNCYPTEAACLAANPGRNCVKGPS
jgi:hypothetical protein